VEVMDTKRDFKQNADDNQLENERKKSGNLQGFIFRS
jgi:hypothetical protein